MKKHITLTVAGSLLMTSTMGVAATKHANAPEKRKIATADNERITSAITESEIMIFQYMIAAAVANEQGANLVKVDQSVRDRYDRIAKSFGYSVPMTAVGGGLSFYFGPETLKASAKYAGPLLAWMKPALQLAWEGLVFSGKKIDALWRLLALDKVADFSSDQIESSYKSVIQPVLQSLVKMNTSILSGASASSGLLYTSIKFTTTNSSEAMSWETMRSLLGQDDVIHGRISSLVDGIAPFLQLDASAKAALEIAIYDRILQQAVDNKFSEDESKYDLDLISIMKEQKIVDSTTASALEKLRTLASTLDLKAANSRTSKEIIDSNVQNALVIASVLEANLKSDKIKDTKVAASMQRQLGLIGSHIALINLNRGNK